MNTMNAGAALDQRVIVTYGEAILVSKADVTLTGFWYQLLVHTNSHQ